MMGTGVETDGSGREMSEQDRLKIETLQNQLNLVKNQLEPYLVAKMEADNLRNTLSTQERNAIEQNASIESLSDELDDSLVRDFLERLEEYVSGELLFLPFDENSSLLEYFEIDESELESDKNKDSIRNRFRELKAIAENKIEDLPAQIESLDEKIQKLTETIEEFQEEKLVQELKAAIKTGKRNLMRKLEETGTPLIDVSAVEWKEAKTFFENSTELKYKKSDNSKHSFIKVGGEIYAIATKNNFEKDYHLLGEGAFGKVRMVQTESGQNFAVKIEGRDLRGEEDAETKISKLVNFFIAEAVREISGKEFKEKFTTQKLYTIMKLKKGDELANELYFNPNIETSGKEIPLDRKLLFALKACESIQALHDQGIIHADIKPNNFMVDINGNTITIEAIDFGFSLLLEEGIQSLELDNDQRKGTQGYMAPEITHAKPGPIYSFSSDVYALGAMFVRDLKLPEELSQGMCEKDPLKRPKLPEVIDKIKSALVKLENSQNAKISQQDKKAKTRAHPLTPDYKSTKSNSFLLKESEFKENVKKTNLTNSTKNRK